MRNVFTASKSPGKSQFASKEQEDLQKIYHRLKQLHEIQDESRNELCPILQDEESIIKMRRSSHSSANHVNNEVNILKELDYVQQIPQNTRAQSQFSSKKSCYNYLVDDDLRESNKRLQEDNEKLFNQCIRLKKITLSFERSGYDFQKKRRSQNSLKMQADIQGENGALKQQINDLKRHKRILQRQIQRLSSQASDQQLKVITLEKVAFEAEKLQSLNRDLVTKIYHLKQELEQSNFRNHSKSSQSINNSTQQSRKNEGEKDRMISNMKIVHDSEVRKYKGIIQELKKELGKDRQSSSFSNVAHFKR